LAAVEAFAVLVNFLAEPSRASEAVIGG